MDSAFWTGVRLVINGLADAAKKASFCVGFGAGGFGIALVIVAKLGITGIAALLISISAFFIMARLGKAVDAYADRALLESSKKRKSIGSDRGTRVPSELTELQQQVVELKDELKRVERDRLGPKQD
jgi:hypothetical protein